MLFSNSIKHTKNMSVLVIFFFFGELRIFGSFNNLQFKPQYKHDIHIQYWNSINYMKEIQVTQVDLENNHKIVHTRNMNFLIFETTWKILSIIFGKLVFSELCYQC